MDKDKNKAKFGITVRLGTAVYRYWISGVHQKELTFHSATSQAITRCLGLVDRYFPGWAFGVEQNILLSELSSKISNLKPNSVEIVRSSRRLKFFFNNEEQKRFTLELINDILIKEAYKPLDVKGRDVVDVGAAIGDTSIYFALKGARRVYAYEPQPQHFWMAQKNTKYNGFSNRIKVYKKAVCIKTDKGCISLDDIVKGHNIKDGSLKVDCDGCEYNIILKSSNKTLLAFKDIILEYSAVGGYNGSPGPLISRLNGLGYRTEDRPHRGQKMGILFATKDEHPGER
ncbi:MAG: FkbM family methyltransferase [Candidatus Micrarchaeaceae archaeon]|jgi:hypothetical protein